VHRDIKPGNVLISRAGDVKLTDFGVTGSLDNTMAKMTTFVGTARYMAPEQLGGKAYSFPADVWALGICLAEFATGMHPYEHYKTASHMELLLKMRSEPMPELPDAFSAGFRQFVGLCLEMTPERRAPVAAWTRASRHSPSPILVDTETPYGRSTWRRRMTARPRSCRSPRSRSTASSASSLDQSSSIVHVSPRGSAACSARRRPPGRGAARTSPPAARPAAR
jgi:serine/threonine protein kinase